MLTSWLMSHGSSMKQEDFFIIKIRNKETVEKTKHAEQRKVAQPPPYATLHLRQDLRMPLFLSLANHNSQSRPLSFSGRHSLSLSFQLSSALNGAHREDFDGGWGSGMISLKESSIKQEDEEDMEFSRNYFLGKELFFCC
ncbi:hypothetical protein QL285_088576 [Trifolium repens]|nr:hypothetical protein QL285_088576 [Trifolium repens]